MQRGDHAKKVRTDDECNHRNQMLFATASIKKCDRDDNENDFERNEHSVNRAIETTRVLRGRSNMRRDEHDACRNQNRNQKEQSRPRPAKVVRSSRDPQNRETCDDNRADRIQIKNLPRSITCSPSNQMSKSRPTQSMCVLETQFAPVCSA